LQGVNINDKHIEVIVRQMMRWIKVEDVGDTEFLLDEQVDKFRFYEENERVESGGGQPAKGRPLLLGITKASLSTDSFISAASSRPGRVSPTTTPARSRRERAMRRRCSACRKKHRPPRRRSTPTRRSRTQASAI